MDKRAVFSHAVDSGLSSRCNVKDIYLCAIFPHDSEKSHYTLQETHIVYFIILRRFYRVIVLGDYWTHRACRNK